MSVEHADGARRNRRERHLQLFTDAYLRTLHDARKITRYRFACLSARERSAEVEPAPEIA